MSSMYRVGLCDHLTEGFRVAAAGANYELRQRIGSRHLPRLMLYRHASAADVTGIKIGSGEFRAS
jgi:hypothetical protein